MRVMDMKDLRRRLSLSQADLAAKLGLTQGTISRFERGDLELDQRTILALEAIAMKATPANSARRDRGDAR